MAVDLVQGDNPPDFLAAARAYLACGEAVGVAGWRIGEVRGFFSLADLPWL